MKAYTDLEQSKRLTEILPLESADMFWTYDFVVNDINGLNVISNNFKPENKDIPAWSLAALLDYMHKVDLFPDITDFNGEFKLVVSYVNEEEEKILGNVQTIISRNENLIDACVEMIVKLNELKLL